MKKRIITALAAIALFGVVIPGTAEAEVKPEHKPKSAWTHQEMITEGKGFKVSTNLGVTHLSPELPYVITFESEGVRARHTPYLRPAVEQLKGLGVNVSIGGVEHVEPNTCPPAGHVIFRESYRPSGRMGYSNGTPCHETTTHAAFGGWVNIDSEYFMPGWNMPEFGMHAVFPHELLHALGLAHADHAKQECVTTGDGDFPLMCSFLGGNQDEVNYGKLTEYDVAGIKAMQHNARTLGFYT